MTSNLDPTPTEEQKSPRSGVIKFLFVVVFAVLIFLLAQSMGRHRFHSGGGLYRKGLSGR